MEDCTEDPCVFTHLRNSCVWACVEFSGSSKLIIVHLVKLPYHLVRQVWSVYVMKFILAWWLGYGDLNTFDCHLCLFSACPHEFWLDFVLSLSFESSLQRKQFVEICNWITNVLFVEGISNVGATIWILLNNFSVTFNIRCYEELW